jgi:hypothetical protein
MLATFVSRHHYLKSYNDCGPSSPCMETFGKYVFDGDGDFTKVTQERCRFVQIDGLVEIMRIPLVIKAVIE